MAKRKSRKSFKSIVMGSSAPRKKSRKSHSRKAKTTARRRRRTSVASGTVHRPRVKKIGTRWYRSKRSRLFSGPTMLNPRRRRRNRKTRHNAVRRYRRYARRHNPLNFRSIINRNVLMTVGKAGAGIAIGYLAMPLLVKILPQSLKQNRKYLGGIHVLAGLVLAGTMKNRNIKEVGMYIAATGVYDLIAMNIPQLGLAGLPSTNILIDKMIPSSLSAPAAPAAVQGSYPVAMLPVSPVAAAGLNGGYQSSRAAGYAGSYQAPDMRTQGFGSDSPFEDIEGFE